MQWTGHNCQNFLRVWSLNALFGYISHFSKYLQNQTSHQLSKCKLNPFNSETFELVQMDTKAFWLYFTKQDVIHLEQFQHLIACYLPKKVWYAKFLLAVRSKCTAKEFNYHKLSSRVRKESPIADTNKRWDIQLSYLISYVDMHHDYYLLYIPPLPWPEISIETLWRIESGNSDPETCENLYTCLGLALRLIHTSLIQKL